MAMWFSRPTPEMQQFRAAADMHTATLKDVRRGALVTAVKAVDPMARESLVRSTDALKSTLNATLDRL